MGGPGVVAHRRRPRSSAGQCPDYGVIRSVVVLVVPLGYDALIVTVAAAGTGCVVTAKDPLV